MKFITAVAALLAGALLLLVCAEIGLDRAEGATPTPWPTTWVQPDVQEDEDGWHCTPADGSCTEEVVL